MEDILFSVIIPVYNRESLVGDAIESVLNQTYSNWEAILINDGSTDNSLEVLRKYEKLDSRIKVIDKENGGVSSARNCGLDVAKGDYIVFCDSDDLLSQDELLTLNKYINEYGRIDIFCFGIIFDFEKRISVPPYSYELNKVFKSDYINTELIPSVLHLIKDDTKELSPLCTLKIYNRECIEKNKIRFDTKLRTWEDEYFTLNFLKFAKNVVFINETLYIYRFKADNKLSNHYSLQVIKDLCYKFNYYKQCFQTYDFYNQTTCSWYFNRINSYIIEMIELKKSINPVELRELFCDTNIKIWYKKAKKSCSLEKKIAKRVEKEQIDDIIILFERLNKIMPKVKKKQIFFRKVKVKLTRIFKRK